MKPVSTTAVPGTPWCVVWTDKGRVFYFNPSTKTSVWHRPAELREREDVDKMVSKPPAVVTQLASNTNCDHDESSRHSTASQNAADERASPAGHADKRVKLDTDTGSSGQASGTTSTVRPFSSVRPAKKELISEAEKEALRKRETIPFEERVQIFRALLQEKEVNPNSMFQKELSKIVFDPRYLLLLSDERRDVFEKWCLEKADEERRRRRETMKRANDDFKQLLADAKLTSRSLYDDFHARYSRDPRYRAVERTKDREILFGDHLAMLRRQERENKSSKASSSGGAAWPTSKQRAASPTATSAAVDEVAVSGNGGSVGERPSKGAQKP